MLTSISIQNRLRLLQHARKQHKIVIDTAASD